MQVTETVEAFQIVSVLAQKQISFVLLRANDQFPEEQEYRRKRTLSRAAIVLSN